MSKQSMTQHPNGDNYTAELHPARHLQASALAISGVAKMHFGAVTETNICRQQPLPAPQKALPKAVTWPPRLGARPTDQQSAALTPYQLQLFIDGTADPFRKVPSIPHAHPETDSQVSPSELLWLYERTTNTFGKEIVDELFTFHLGCIPHREEHHPKSSQMPHLYEAFVDTFGETDAHLLFADAFYLRGEESATPELETVPTY